MYLERFPSVSFNYHYENFDNLVGWSWLKTPLIDMRLCNGRTHPPIGVRGRIQNGSSGHDRRNARVYRDFLLIKIKTRIGRLTYGQMYCFNTPLETWSCFSDVSTIQTTRSPIVGSYREVRIHLKWLMHWLSFVSKRERERKIRYSHRDVGKHLGSELQTDWSTIIASRTEDPVKWPHWKQNSL